MKVAYVLNTYPAGSHSFIRREIQALERLGVDVCRFAIRAPDGPMVDALNQAEQARTEYVLNKGGGALLRASMGVLLRSLGRWISTLRLALGAGARSETGRLRHMIYFAEACSLARRIGDENIQHMHAHFGTNAATVAMLVSGLTGVPFSFTVHGPEEFDHPQALSLGTKMERAAFTVGISQFGRSQLCRWVAPEHWDRIKVVHCGIEPDAFPDPRPVPDSPLRLVNIGRFAEQKGQVLLIESLAMVRAAGTNAHLTLIGDGEMRPQIEQAIAQHDLSEHVTLTGWVDEVRIRFELDASHTMVVPSFAEGLPMVVMESMAAARPVIATYIAGIPELVSHGENGWLVPAGDVTALAQAIAEVSRAGPGELHLMGQAARRRVFERHDVDVEAAKLLEQIRVSTTG